MRSTTLLACLIAGAGCAQTKPSADPTFQMVLQRLDENRQNFYKSVPSLFCSEYVVSSVDRENQMQAQSRTLTDSTFRLVRTANAQQQVELKESRSVRTINGIPSTSDDAKLQGPSIVSGVFSNGLTLVSTPMQGCFDYTMKLHHSHKRVDRIIIQFKEIPDGRAADFCPQYENSIGSVVVDPVTMQVIKIQKTIPLRELVPHVYGMWSWDAEYAPVQLGDKKVWLPHTVHSFSRGKRLLDPTAPDALQKIASGQDHWVWNFDATYSNFHRLSAKARIFPAGQPLPKD